MATYAFLIKRGDGADSALDSIKLYQRSYWSAAKARRRFGKNDHYRQRYVSAAWDYRRLIRQVCKG